MDRPNPSVSRRASHIAASLLLAFLLSGPAAAASITAVWQSGFGVWSDATQWSSNPLAPDNGGGNTFDVEVGSGNPSLDADVSIEALALSGGLIDGAADLTVNDVLTWTAGSFGGTGTTVANAGVEITGTSSKTLDSRTLDSSADTNHRGGSFTLRDGALFVNRTGASFRLDSDVGTGGSGQNLTIGSSGSTPNILRNEGSLVQAGSQTSTISARLENSGSLDVQNGTLQLSGLGSASTGGSMHVANGASLRFIGGVHDLDAASGISGGGRVEFAGGSVNHAGSYTVTGSTRAQSGTATLSGGAGSTDALELAGGVLDIATGTFAVNGPLTWTAGTLRGPGTTRASGGIEITGTSSKTLDENTLENDGVAHYRGGSWTLRDNASFVNRVGGVFTIDSDPGSGGTGQNLTIGSSGSTPNVLRNEGSLVQAGSQTSTISARLENSGSVDVQNGTLQLSGLGSTSTGGSMHVASGASLRFIGGVHDLDAASGISGGGRVEFAGATVNHAGSYTVTGTTRAQSGTATLSGGAGSTDALELAGGVLDIATGTFDVNGPLTWTAGTLRGPGTTRAGGGIEITGTSSKTLDENTLENDGVAHYHGGSWTLRDNASFVNRVGGVFTIDSDPGSGGTGQNLTIGSSGGAPNVLRNEGILVQAGSQTTTIAARLENDASIGVTDGTLQLSGLGSSSTGGSVDISSGATLRFIGGVHDLDAASTLGGEGAIHFAGGTVNHAGGYGLTGTTRAQSGTATLSGGSGNTGTLELAGGVLDIASGSFTVTDTLAWTAGTLRGPGTTVAETTLEITGTSSKTLDEQTLENAGVAHYRGGSWTLRDTATFVNRAGASFVADSDPGLGGTGQNLSIGSSGGRPNVFRNQGSLLQGGTQTTTIAADFENSGDVSIIEGQLTLSGDTTQTAGRMRLDGGSLRATRDLLIQGGVLEGVGVVDADVDLAGRIAPGVDGVGSLTILGDLIASSTAEFSIELAGTTAGSGYDVLDVTGDVTLDGALSVSFQAGFDSVVTGADLFTVLDSDGTLSGGFANVLAGERLTTVEGHSFQVDYGAASPFGANRVVLSAFQAVPEPSSAMLLGVGLALLARRTRR